MAKKEKYITKSITMSPELAKDIEAKMEKEDRKSFSEMVCTLVKKSLKKGD